jgi:hypothetical protein
MNTPEFRSEHPIGSFEHALDWHVHQSEYNAKDYFYKPVEVQYSRYALYCLEQNRQRRATKPLCRRKEWLIFFACSIGITAFVTIFCIWLELMKR